MAKTWIFSGDTLTPIGTVKDFKYEWKGFDTSKTTDTVFDWSKTYTIDLKLSDISINLSVGRKVKPEEVGVNLPGLKFIGLNTCAGTGTHWSNSYFSSPGILGHAHKCPKDPDVGMICTREEWLKNSDGTYSDILLHETAHILTDYGIIESKECNTYEEHKFLINGVPEYDTQGWYDWHGSSWKEWAIKLGATPSRFGNIPW